MDWQSMSEIVPQLLSDGLALGFVYAIVALGYTMVYGILQFINFAHSDIFMFGAFAGTEVLLWLRDRGFLGGMPAWAALLVALLFAMSVSGMLGVAVEKIAYKPVRGRALVPFISAIGVSFVIEDLVRFIEEARRGSYFLYTPDQFLGKQIKLFEGMEIKEKTIYVVVLCLSIMLVLTLFVSRHKWGKAMRAVALDKDTASLMGIDVNRVISLTFLIGAAMGGAAGTLFSVQYGSISPYSGFVIGMKSFTAAVFGGIGKLPGAMLGGLLLGLLETFGAAFLGIATNNVLGSEYKDVFAFVILIAILIVRPSGLLGKPAAEKV